MSVVATTRGTTEVLHRAHAHRRDGVDLLGHAHVPELARHRAAGARGDDDGGEHGRELARQRQGDDAADHALGRELTEADDGAHRERHPGEEADEADDEGRAGADEVERDEELRRAERRADSQVQRLPRRGSRSSRARRRGENADRVDAVHELRHTRCRIVGGDRGALVGRRRSTTRECTARLRLAVEARNAAGDRWSAPPSDRAGVRSHLVGADGGPPRAALLRARGRRPRRAPLRPAMSVTSIIAMSIETAPDDRRALPADEHVAAVARAGATGRRRSPSESWRCARARGARQVAP